MKVEGVSEWREATEPEGEDEWEERSGIEAGRGDAVKVRLSPEKEEDEGEREVGKIGVLADAEMKARWREKGSSGIIVPDLVC
jgi:hypothetical protein